jgi:hypothetical protein
LEIVGLIELLSTGKFDFVTFSVDFLERPDSIALRNILRDLSQCRGNRILERFLLMKEGFKKSNIRV